jgi:hypothetical protein
MESPMRKVRDSSGVLVLVEGTVMAVGTFLSLLVGDWFSAAVFGSLAAAAFVADLVLRRRSERPVAVDLFLAGAIFAIFAMLFGFNRDWRLVAASGLIAVTAWLVSSVLYSRYVRARSNASPGATS